MGKLILKRIAKLALRSHSPRLHHSHRYLQRWASGPTQKVVRGGQAEEGQGWAHMPHTHLSGRPLGPWLTKAAVLKPAYMLGSHLSLLQCPDRDRGGRLLGEPACLQVFLYSGFRNQKDQTRVTSGSLRPGLQPSAPSGVGTLPCLKLGRSEAFPGAARGLFGDSQALAGWTGRVKKDVFFGTA